MIYLETLLFYFFKRRKIQSGTVARYALIIVVALAIDNMYNMLLRYVKEEHRFDKHM